MHVHRGRTACLALALVCLVVSAAAADLPPTAQWGAGVLRPFNARVWGMGGASTALADGADCILANPASAVFLEGNQASFGLIQEELVTSLTMYDASASGSMDLSGWGIAYASGAEESPGRRQGAGIVFVDAEETFGLPLKQLTFGGGSGSETAAIGGTLDVWTFGAGYQAEYNLGVGALWRSPEGLSLGFNWDDALSSIEGVDLDVLTLGAAYERDRFTVAVDLHNATGTDFYGESALMAGVEARLDGGVALRVGSMDGEMSYGLGYRGKDWAIDYAHLEVDGSEAIVPGLTMAVEDTFDFITFTYYWEK